ncbi:MAG TPA: type II secretion system protein [Steroidobacteraceae bacterium]|jgi:prepilin-type N-terminal cleavage/methylation domain-containing protein
MRRPRLHSGFTLVESVVALAILALSLSVVYESFGWSLRRTAGVEKREAAWLTAQSLLASVRGCLVLSESSDRGEAADGLQWETHIVPADAAIDPQSAVKPFEVTIDVSWGARPGQRITLRSVETARVTP